MARAFTTNQLAEYAGDAGATLPFSVACWVRPTAVNVVQVAWSFCINTTANQYYYLGLDASGQASIAARNTTARIGSSSTAMLANTWGHLCGVWAAANDRRVFLNGGGKGTQTNSVTAFTPTRSTAGRISGSTPASYFGGRIAEIGLWNVALTDMEAAALGSGVPPSRVRPGNLIGYWRLDGRVTPEPDLSGFAHPLTVTGATLADHAPAGAPYAGFFEEALGER